LLFIVVLVLTSLWQICHYTNSTFLLQECMSTNVLVKKCTPTAIYFQIDQDIGVYEFVFLQNWNAWIIPRDRYKQMSLWSAVTKQLKKTYDNRQLCCQLVVFYSKKYIVSCCSHFFLLALTNIFHVTWDWMKEYSKKLYGTVILHHYKEYMEDNDIAEKDREMQFCFFCEIVGCVNLTWKEKSLQGGTFSKLVRTSDEAFMLFIMWDYDKIPTKDDRKEDKLVGERL